MADQDKLLVEVNRQHALFKQRFRGEGVTSAVLQPERRSTWTKVAASFQKNLGIEGSFSPMEAFDASQFGDRAAKLDGYPSLCLPVGAAMRHSGTPSSISSRSLYQPVQGARPQGDSGRASIILLIVMSVVTC